ncbi:NmrA family NAD(P)-binding protein [Pengzhenrongella frigida]|uniref:SDR family NAD(P)-dependent oxidoreductase n=1 Tax=Pengzhenrongella frigida TaxID=1259133 RepID=A0A4Q5N0N8_9MICO|nr:NmrA family NAD(P)-binding protein [Cellulomonas sp. HLT2-17]RYV49571.1 SDR family NAD(P)-dependent oxidoreductase [Cellulomonas sp. HLT2-17]
MAAILVTGASGNVGGAVVRALDAAGADVRRAQRPGGPGGPGTVDFDFTDPATWAQAFAGVESMFLVRPPAVGNVKRDLVPAVSAARDAGVRHVVFLSLQGAQTNKVVPHAAVEKWLRASGMDWTFVRASFFHQNLSTTHVSDVRDRNEIVVPAGRGATAFVDADDVGAVAAAALLDPAAHRNTAWTITGPEALTYDEVARILTAELGRPIRYARPGVLRYARHARQNLGMGWGMVAVTSAIYTTARLGMAAGLSDDVRTVLGRDPIDFAEFAYRERAVWNPDPVIPTV